MKPSAAARDLPTTGAPGLVLLGLGPGDPGLLSGPARAALLRAERLWTDAPGHPALGPAGAAPAALPADPSAVAGLLVAAAAFEPVTCAVLGDPHLDAAALLGALAEEAQRAGLPLAIHRGVAWWPEALAAVGDEGLAPASLARTGLQTASAASLISRNHPDLDPGRPGLIDLAGLTAEGAARLARLLAVAYGADHPLWWLLWRTPGKAALATTVGGMADGTPAGARLLLVPALPRYHSWLDLAEVVAHLRAPDGCPWDKEQTHESLRPYLLEEAYEAVEALDARDWPAFCDELGDLLLQVVLHAQVAVEAGRFALRDVLAAITGKLIRRHPHVFGEVRADTAEEVLVNWEALKQAERAAKDGAATASVTDPLQGVPRAMPALARAQLMLRKGRRVPDLAALLPRADGAALPMLLARFQAHPDEAALAELLWQLTAQAQTQGLDAEEALRGRLRRFADPPLT